MTFLEKVYSSVINFFRINKGDPPNANFKRTTDPIIQGLINNGYTWNGDKRYSRTWKTTNLCKGEEGYYIGEEICYEVYERLEEPEGDNEWKVMMLSGDLNYVIFENLIDRPNV